MKNRLSNFICSTCFFFVTGTFAQNGPAKINIIQPSPNSAALAKYVDFPTVQASGVPSISLPLGAVGSKDISLPISINYHAGGNKVEDQASWVGLGWTVSGGGSITRTVRGLPDDLANGNQIGFNFMGQKISDHLNHVYDDTEDRAFMKQCADGLYDTEPDQYYFSFQGKSGKIIFDANGNGTVVPYQKIKITRSGNAFALTDEAGFRYQFEDYEYTETLDACETFTVPPFISTWQLSSIAAPGGESAYFTYQQGTTYQYSMPSETVYISMGCPNSMGGSDCLKHYKISTARLSTITIGNNTVDFIANINRTDLPSPSSEMRLEGLEFKSGGSVIKKIGFEYGVFGCNKLRLNLVKQYNPLLLSSYDLLYRFDYLNPESVPCITSKSQDHWGFMNTNNTGSLVPPGKLSTADGQVTIYPGADRSPNFDAAKAGVLSRISYPTGGYTQFDYELNSYGFINQGKVSDWVYTDTDISVLASPSNQTEEQYFSLDYTQNVTLNYQVNVSDQSSENFSVYEYITLINTSNNSTITVQSSGSGSQTLTLPAGTYKLVAYSENPFTHTSASLGYKVKSNTEIITKSTGGLRVTRITDYDGVSGAADMVRNFKYTMSDEPSRSSGVVAGEPNYESYFVSYIEGSPCTYYVRTATSTGGLGNGGHIGYREVVVETSNGSGTLSKFSTFYEYPDQLSVVSYTPPTTSYEFLRGLLLNRTDYKTVAGIKVKVSESSSHYTVDPLNHYTKVKGSKIVYHIRAFGLVPDSFYEYPFEYSTMWFYQDQTGSVSYDLNGQNPVTRSKIFKYENPLHVQPTRVETIGSDGVLETELTSYPLDYAGGSGFTDELNTAHLVSYPVEKVRYRTGVQGDIKILGGSIIKYKPGGKGLRDEEFYLETESPVNMQAFRFSNRSAAGIMPFDGIPSSFQPDGLYKPRLKINQYDSLSNLLEYQLNDGSKHSFLWGYGQSYPIAEAVNAPQAEIAYTSFEEDGKGTWNYGGMPVPSSSSLTGYMVYELGNGSLTKTGLSSSTIYVLGYYTTNSAPFTVAGTVGDIERKAQANGWNYFEHRLSGIEGVTLSGTGIVDEIRLYPLQAKMTTYTYRPQVGMTSSTDGNGMVTYYEYDEFQRLKVIKDWRGDILKSYDYHYKN